MDLRISSFVNFISNPLFQFLFSQVEDCIDQIGAEGSVAGFVLQPLFLCNFSADTHGCHSGTGGFKRLLRCGSAKTADQCREHTAASGNAGHGGAAVPQDNGLRSVRHDIQFAGNSDDREALGTTFDIVGLHICVPGDQVNAGFTKKLTIRLPEKDKEDEVEDIS